ncbi:type III secretion system gatekeeper subunit SctW [Erwiniaceae bacterium BAC15a-03b]|uniref:Type III secretion system gatekeeper subunit SctW n=1 Tax=Winslowiella arboricola TaxID=2978220 RepID=A0A9J6PRY8_9GAMM|nr:type III secretion system gatekeeper subunit SctW [Winslowiella arboricola]MCU5773672.1 type III secretion system gatekeeper subunit SctW [Winslowiella arboricola]MCU5778429.1 type III secretion system gatekeeper subunit SctW [Winslowiella arboricola]
MIKMQPAIPAMQHTLKALLKGTEAAAAKNANRGPDNVRTRAETQADSLEEIGSMFSEKMESKNKAQNRRQMQSNLMRNKHSVAKVEHLDQLFQLMDSNEEQVLEQQLGLMREALARSPAPSSEELLQEMGGDPARCDVMLRMVQQQASTDGDTKLADAASQHLSNLLQQHGDSIRAGSNTASAIAEFTSDPAEKQSLRNLYYNSIVHQQSAMAMLDLLLDQVEPRHFVPTLRTLQRALADDIAALAPSITAGALRHIRHGLHEAGQLNHTLAASSTLLKRMTHKLPEVALTAVDLTRRLLQLSHNGAYNSDFQHLGQEVVGAQPQHLSLFFSCLFPLVHQLPHSLWKEPDQRKTALQLLRGIITELAKAEQQQLARRAS